MAGEGTLFKGIKELLPGHWLKLKNGELGIHQYWDISAITPIKISEAKALEQLEQGLSKSVRLRMVSDAKLGLMISGGVDSGLVAEMAQRNVSVYNKQLTGIHISFEKEGYSELAFAQQVADRIGAELSVIQADETHILEAMEKLVWNYDEPIHDTTSMALYLICEHARKLGLKVLLSGDGSDETFAGYDRYIEIAKQYAKNPKNEVIMLARNTISVAKAPRFYSGGTQLAKFRTDFMKKLQGKSTLMKELLLDQVTFLESYLHRQDKVGMACGIELRVPFLYHELVEFVNSLPDEFKINGDESKYLLKQLALKVLPKESIHRQKQPFSAPIGKSFRQGKAEKYLHMLLASDARTATLFDVNGIKQLIEENKQGMGSGDKPLTNDAIDHTRILWELVALELWMRAYSL